MRHFPTTAPGVEASTLSSYRPSWSVMPCAVLPGFWFSLVAIGTNVTDAFGSGLPSSITRPATLATRGGWGPQPITTSKDRPIAIRTITQIAQAIRRLAHAETPRRREFLDDRFPLRLC